MAELSYKTDLISPFIALNILYNRYRFDTLHSLFSFTEFKLLFDFKP